MKTTLFCVALLAFTTSAFAGSKPESPSKIECETKATTYWVVGVSGTNYTLSSYPNPRCGEAEDIACEIVSLNLLTNNLAPIHHVENETNGFTIISRQPLP